MATSILHSVRGRRNGTLRSIESTIEDQIDTLRDEISSLAKMVSKNGASQGSKLREQAEAGLEELMNRSDELLHELQKGYIRGSREVKATVRRHPTATVGAAAILGVLVVALLARR